MSCRGVAVVLCKGLFWSAGRKKGQIWSWGLVEIRNKAIPIYGASLVRQGGEKKFW